MNCRNFTSGLILALMAAPAGCNDGPSTSSSTHWLTCAAVADGARAPGAVACVDGYCVDSAGKKIAESSATSPGNGGSAGGTSAAGGQSTVPSTGDATAGTSANGGATSVDQGTVLTAKQIAAGGDQTCAVTTEGSVRCWGLTLAGDGMTSTSFKKNLAAVEVSGLSASRVSTTADYQVAVGTLHACAIRLGTEGGTVCWGDNAKNKLGAGSGLQNDEIPESVVDLPPYSSSSEPTQLALSAGSEHTCAIAVQQGSRGVYCWGDNAYRQVGLPDAQTRAAVHQVLVDDASIVALSSGNYHSCVVLQPQSSTESRIACSGGSDAAEDQLVFADGNLVPDIVVDSAGNALANPTHIAGGFQTACAVAGDARTVACWDMSEPGAVANSAYQGSYSRQFVATGVPNLQGVVALAVGANHSCAIVADPDVVSRVFCWGDNSTGQLGQSPQILALTSTPVAVSGVEGAVSLAAGDFHSCAIMSDQHVRCWGDSASGQMGIGTTSAEPSAPVEVLTM